MGVILFIISSGFVMRLMAEGFVLIDELERIRREFE